MSGGNGGFGWAAQACDALVINGFDDWYLPSRDELHYLYGHLQMNSLGNLENGSYWSSTAGGTASLADTWGFWCEDFSNGEQSLRAYLYDIVDGDVKNLSRDVRFVRAIRQF